MHHSSLGIGPVAVQPPLQHSPMEVPREQRGRWVDALLEPPERPIREGCGGNGCVALHPNEVEVGAKDLRREA